MDNETYFPLVQTTAGAVQSCSRAWHQLGMGKLGRCWVCNNVMPTHSTDVPKHLGNFPAFCSKSEVVSVFSDVKNIATCLLITERLGKEDSECMKLPSCAEEGREVQRGQGFG